MEVASDLANLTAIALQFVAAMRAVNPALELSVFEILTIYFQSNGTQATPGNSTTQSDTVSISSLYSALRAAPFLVVPAIEIFNSTLRRRANMPATELSPSVHAVHGIVRRGTSSPNTVVLSYQILLLASSSPSDLPATQGALDTAVTSGALLDTLNTLTGNSSAFASVVLANAAAYAVPSTNSFYSKVSQLVAETGARQVVLSWSATANSQQLQYSIAYRKAVTQAQYLAISQAMAHTANYAQLSQADISARVLQFYGQVPPGQWQQTFVGPNTTHLLMRACGAQDLTCSGRCLCPNTGNTHVAFLYRNCSVQLCSGSCQTCNILDPIKSRCCVFTV